jgi:hypothetical protein
MVFRGFLVEENDFVVPVWVVALSTSTCNQCCGSGFNDFVDPDLESGSTGKKTEEIVLFMALKFNFMNLEIKFSLF